MVDGSNVSADRSNWAGHALEKKTNPKKKKWYWRPKFLSATHSPPPRQIDDSEAHFGPIKVTAYQIVDEDEDTFSKQTVSFQRRWRAAVGVFLRRNFTNDPEKVGIVETVSSHFIS